MDGGNPPSSGLPRTAISRLLALVFVSTALVLGIQPGASACSPTDVDCVLEKTEEVVDEGVETVEEVDKTVEDLVSDPEGTVEHVVAGAKERVNDAVGEVIEPPSTPATDDLDVGTPTEPTPRTNKSDRIRGPRTRQPTKSSGSRRQPPLRGLSDRVPPGADDLATASSETVSRAAPIAQSNPNSRDLAEAARRFAFPLLLSALVAVFLFFQGRVDQRDPKLALAPVDNDMILFG